MTTLTPIRHPTPLIFVRSAEPPATLQPSAGVTTRPSSVVSLGAVATAVDTYSRRGLLPGQEPVQAWERDSGDAVSEAISNRFSALSPASRFSGLGATLVGQFAKSGANISQSLLNSTTAKTQNTAELNTEQALLHSKADNLVSLSVKTASGKTVTFSLASQDGGLGVQATVDGGSLSDAELKEIAQLGEAFQGAIDGLTAQPPKLDLGKLTRFDSSVLASIDLNGKLKVDGQDLTLAFHADSQGRTTRMSGPAGEISVAVDLKNTALLGNAKQQAQALKSYLSQFDQAQARGNANPALMGLFKDAFSALNSHYPQGATAPVALTRSPADQGLLSGLADFKASISQASDSPNPMRPSEIDSFAYQIAQKTRVGGRDMQNRSIDQTQQSSLSASYHQGLRGEKSPALGSTAESQNYLYVQIQDKASSSTSIGYKDGQLVKAAVAQTASQNTRTQQYVMGQLVDDVSLPKEASSKHDYVTLLEYAARESRKSKDALEAFTLNEALANMHPSVMLQSDPAGLTR